MVKSSGWPHQNVSIYLIYFSVKMIKSNLKFPYDEEIKLVKLVVKYQHNIECKNTDTITNVEKKEIGSSSAMNKINKRQEIHDLEKE